jgi:hypothetical protein
LLNEGIGLVAGAALGLDADSFYVGPGPHGLCRFVFLFGELVGGFLGKRFQTKDSGHAVTRVLWADAGLALDNVFQPVEGLAFCGLRWQGVGKHLVHEASEDAAVAFKTAMRDVELRVDLLELCVDRIEPEKVSEASDSGDQKLIADLLRRIPL